MNNSKLSKQMFALPYAILAVVFVIIPLVIMMFTAFVDGNGSFTFDNFLNFGNAEVWKVLGRSFIMAFLTTVICLVLAYPTAMILANSRLNKSATIVMLFVLPMWINSLLRIYAVKLIFEDMLGIGFGLVLLGMVYDFFPFMLMPLYTILANMDHSYIEAAEDLGASPLKNFLTVILPLSVPGIISGVLMVFMPTVSTFAVSDILGNPDTYMFGNLINYNMEKGYYNFGSAYSIVMLALIGITTLIANRITAVRGGKK